jgi:hypothetical protein
MTRRGLVQFERDLLQKAEVGVLPDYLHCLMSSRSFKYERLALE